MKIKIMNKIVVVAAILALGTMTAMSFASKSVCCQCGLNGAKDCPPDDF